MADFIAKYVGWSSVSLVLLRFGLENHKSFRDSTELSFVATAQEDSPSWRIEAPHAAHGVLPVLGVWGANATGKSNLIEALQLLQELISDSFVGFAPDEPLPWCPFAMRMSEEDPPTRMDLDILVDGTRYHYGMRFRSTGFIEEWLYSWPKSRKQLLFHRNHSEEDPWYFGPSFRGQRQHIARATRPNSLFLSVAAQYNHEQLKPIYTTITQRIASERRIELRGYPLFESTSPLLDERLKPALVAFLAAADLGVVDLRSARIQVPTDDDAHVTEVSQPEFLRNLAQSRHKEPPLFEIRLVHGTSDTEASWELSPLLESRGTQILLRRIEDFLETLRHGGLLLLDEIETSLHPDLCVALVGLFANPEINRRGAQLLFSTHDRGLLTALRRDEVVLVDKGRDGASILRTAADYVGLRGRDDLRRAHELGRIRGIPVLGDLAGAFARGLA